MSELQIILAQFNLSLTITQSIQSMYLFSSLKIVLPGLGNQGTENDYSK